jgi:hypothetical protein
MSEPICEICGRTIGLGEGCCAHGTPHVYEWEEECYRLGYEREKARAEEALHCCDVTTDHWNEALARADRYEAEFSACKALLIAEQKRAERAEAGRAEAQRDLRDFKRDCDRMLEDAYQGGKRAEARAEEARAALEQLATLADNEGWVFVTESDARYTARTIIHRALRALAALPVEPARRQVTEHANALGAPAARSPATPEEDRK